MKHCSLCKSELRDISGPGARLSTYFCPKCQRTIAVTKEKEEKS